jgi:phosphatidylcholine synthase
MPPGDASPRRVVLAWGVHAFTASGAVVGTIALLAIAANDLRVAALLMLVALWIDSVDGTLARSVGVERVVPDFDGRRLDDMVDFFNYVIVPVVFMVRAGSLLHGGLVALPILASAYGFSQTSAKTHDDFFLGFPSYWNVVGLYLWLFGVSPGVGTAWVVLFTVLVFVPLKYVYPSKLRVLRRTTNALAGVWLLAFVWMALFPERARELHLVELSLAYPIFYLVLSFSIGGVHRPAGGGAPGGR